MLDNLFAAREHHIIYPTKQNKETWETQAFLRKTNLIRHKKLCLGPQHKVVLRTYAIGRFDNEC